MRTVEIGIYDVDIYPDRTFPVVDFRLKDQVEIEFRFWGTEVFKLAEVLRNATR